MNAFNALGFILGLFQLTLTLLVMLSIPAAKKRDALWLSVLFTVVGFATVMWIMRAALWQG